VRSLAGIFCISKDEAARGIARTALCSLVSQPVIDAFCTDALERNDAALNSIAIESNYQPTDPETQALFLFITDQRIRYAPCDPLPHHPLLASGYARATNRVRFHTRGAAIMNGQCPVFAAALIGTEQHGNPVSWSEEEWEIAIPGLIQDREWKELWRLVVHAPLHLAIPALSAMKEAGWKPAGEDQVLWEEICHALPIEWIGPVPYDALSPPKGSPDSQPLRLAFSGDGTLLGATCADGTVYVWNTKMGTLLFKLPAGPCTTSGLAISPDNCRLLCAGSDGILQCRDAVTGALLWSVATGEKAPVPFACTRNGTVVIPLSVGGQLRVLNLADGQAQDSSGGQDAAVSCCALSPDNRYCAVGYADGAVGIWDLQGGHYLQTLEGLGNPVRLLAFGEQGDECLVIYEQNQPARWQIPSGERIRTYTGTSGPLRCCAITPGNNAFAIAGDDRMLRFWQAGSVAPIAEIPLYNRPLTACASSADGRILAAGCTDGTLRIYAMNAGTIIHEKKAHKQVITAIVLSSSAKMVASAGGDGAVKLWNTDSGEIVHTLLHPAGGVTGIAATPDGSKVCAGYTDGKVRQISSETGAFSRMLNMYTSTIRAITITPDGALLACAGGDSTLRIWNGETGGLVASGEGLTTTQQCLAFSRDGTILVSGGWDGKARLWSMPDCQLTKSLTGHTSTITAIAMTPDGTMLATGSNDRSVRLWTLFNGKCVSVQKDSRSEVSALAISPDGGLLAYAGAGAVIHLCYLPDGLPAHEIPALTGTITTLAFAGDGRMLVAGYDTGTVAVFSCAGRHLLRAVLAHTSTVTGIAVLPGGESVLTSSLDGQVRRGNLPWTRPLGKTTLDDIPLIARYERTCPRTEPRAQWAFLHHMLAARFCHDIELCTTINDEHMYDIQIVG
jgi:WD40 repeat protein